MLHFGRNDREDAPEYYEEMNESDDDFENDEPFDIQKDIEENPGDYDEDGERGYWADQ